MSALSRRRFLKGASAALLASPLLPAFSANAQSGTLPKRLVLFFTPHGTIHDQWLPTGSATQLNLGPILAPLAAHRSKLTVLSGMRMIADYHPNTALAPHPIGMATLWTGSRVNDIETVVQGGNVPVGVWSTGPSIDQVVARRVGNDTVFRSLELGVQCGPSAAAYRTIYAGARSALNPTTDPAAAYRALFSAIDSDAQQAAQRRFDKQSMIDLHKAELDGLLARGSVADRAKLQAHLASLRDLERQLVSGAPRCASPATPRALDAGAVGNRPELLGQHSALLAAALACDLTRVASLQFSTGHDNVSYPWLNYNGAHHDNLSHDEGTPAARAMRVKICTWYASQFAVLLDALAAVPEGGGTLLDNTLVVWGTECANGGHGFSNMPFVVAGGAAHGVRGGRLLATGAAPHQRLLVAIGRSMGLTDLNAFGDLDPGTGPLPGLLG